MSHFLIVYFGGKQPETHEEGQRHFAKYKQWLTDISDVVISPANPIKNTNTINSDGQIVSGSSTSMSGYTIIQADSIEAAIDIAKGCPFLEFEGCLEVSELIDMKM